MILFVENVVIFGVIKMFVFDFTIIILIIIFLYAFGFGWVSSAFFYEWYWLRYKKLKKKYEGEIKNE